MSWTYPYAVAAAQAENKQEQVEIAAGSRIKSEPVDLLIHETLYDKEVWKHRAPYRPVRPIFHEAFVGLCNCGLVQFQVRGDPIAAKVCHCKKCQVLHGEFLLDQSRGRSGQGRGLR